jgi:hypothetical protein
MAGLAKFHAWIWEGLDVGKFLIDLGVRNIFDTKLHGLGACHLLAGWLAVSLHYMPD